MGICPPLQHQFPLSLPHNCQLTRQAPSSHSYSVAVSLSGGTLLPRHTVGAPHPFTRSRRAAPLFPQAPLALGTEPRMGCAAMGTTRGAHCIRLSSMGKKNPSPYGAATHWGSSFSAAITLISCFCLTQRKGLDYKLINQAFTGKDYKGLCASLGLLLNDRARTKMATDKKDYLKVGIILGIVTAAPATL